MPSHSDRLPQLKRAIHEAAPGDAKSALEATLAEQLIVAGDYAEALVHLGAARRAASTVALREHVDVLMGLALLRRGEIDRAEPHLQRVLEAVRERKDRAAEARVQVYLGEVYSRRGELDRADQAFHQARKGPNGASEKTGELAARALTGLAAVALERGLLDESESDALAACDAAGSEIGQAGARSAALLVLADALRRKQDWAGADRVCRQAIDVATSASLPRELAEAYFCYARIIGVAAGAIENVEPPASWLALAQDLYREHGALADLERVRDAFRTYGRRTTDRIGATEVKNTVDDLQKARLQVARDANRLVDSVVTSLSRVALQVEPPVRDQLSEITRITSETESVFAITLEAMSAAEARVFGAMQSVISERENIRTLLDLCRTLNELNDYGLLVSGIAKMAAQLTGADRAAVVEEERGVPVARSAWHMDANIEIAWRSAVEPVLRGGGPTLIQTTGAAAAKRASDDARLGHALVTPLRVGKKLFGAVYVDKELCGGMFAPHDLDLLSIFCGQAATMLENAHAAGQLRLAARSRAATLEAISDAVLSFDRAGTITSLNAVAARITHLDVGAQLSSATLPDFAIVRAALDHGEELDGRVTRIGAGEFLLNLRTIRSDVGDVVGGVATLSEMKRVQSIAQRIVGSQARYSFGDLIGQAPALRRRLQLAEAAARSDSGVLITGESGTGKEVLAQSIHNASVRAGGPFVAINCSAIPRELLESELFGYEGGAFTGAKKGGHPGKFELAEGGTILLDEIGDMPIEMQAKLLRVLQERRVHRVGGMREVTLDARVIATTNRDLDDTVARGQFRSDLLFRLKVIHIMLPPLRERASDIPVLVSHFLTLFTARMGKGVRSLSPPVMEAFMHHPWPGNIRELENVLEGEINLAEPNQTELDQVPDALKPRLGTKAAAGGVALGSADGSGLCTLEEAERDLVTRALSRHGGAIPEVARTLGISRGTVYNMLKRFALDADTFRKK